MDDETTKHESPLAKVLELCERIDSRSLETHEAMRRLEVRLSRVEQSQIWLPLVFSTAALVLSLLSYFHVVK